MENNRSSFPSQIGRIPAALDADFHADNTKGWEYYFENDVLLLLSATRLILLFSFSLEQTIPKLYTNQSFDREQKAEIRFKVIAYDCQLACRDPKNPANATITVVLTIKDVNDNFPKFTEKSYHATVIQGQASPGSHLANVYATDPDEEKEGLRYAISGAVRTSKRSYGLTDSPISINAKTGELTANDALHEASYSFTVTVTDGVGHEDSANVVISVVAYSQQFELLFDAPYDFIKRNQKNIVRLLSNATSLTAVVDRCRQNTNFTVVLTHFLDHNGEFVAVERAM
ncbi:cadherin domain protein, partial [Ostertagia ostertagi]